ncbi:MAG TPA: M1 family aminopeptidase [bacterium]|nr:M1 family aminopeptidase [bacterium]
MTATTTIKRRQCGRIGRLIILAISLCAADDLSAKTITRIAGWDQAVYDSLDHPTIDPARVYAVRAGAAWAGDLGTWIFESGTIHLLQTVGGRPTGCYFTGQGRLRYEPPTGIERGQLARFCGDSILESSFMRLYARFFDSLTAAGLWACLDTLVTEPRLPRAGAVRQWEETANDDLAANLAAQGWRMLLRDPAPNTFLYLAADLAGQRQLHFILDEENEEAINLLRRPQGTPDQGAFDLVCSYDRRRRPDESGARAALVNGGFAIVEYDSRVLIRSSAKVELDVIAKVVPRRDRFGDMAVTLAPRLDVDSILLDGRPLPFIYNDKAGWLVLRIPEPLRRGDTTDLRFFYRGDQLLNKYPWGDFAIRYTTRWVPVGRPLERARYRTAFTFPKHYELVSSGELLSDSVQGDWRTKVWRTYNPSCFVSFNYGSFDILTSTMMEGTRLDIYRSRNHPTGLFAGDIKKAVAEDIEGAVRLFSRSFGPYPWPHLAATEIPAIHGQGFPQLLHLAWYSFETSRKGITDAFRAHEVAHQWFGHLVGWSTYHDQWLSEGFAEYAGAMYVQARNPGAKVFYELLKDWRDNILQVGGHEFWHEGPSAAPIWLGTRCSSMRSPGSYSKLVYSKGAYVLHMLRNMMYDYERGSDDRFLAMMRDYVSSFAHRDATTRDFQAVVERHVGADMQWFFDQWVYGTQIPRYEYSWERERADDGTWTARVRIDQFNVDSAFRAFMPITIVYEDGQRTRLLEVTGPRTEFRFSGMAERPRDIRFNDYYTILCEERIVAKP